MARSKLQTKKKDIDIFVFLRRDQSLILEERDCRQCGLVDFSLIVSSLEILDH